MTTKQLIEALCLMFCIWTLRMAFLAAGCWMMYNGWYGCGMTTVVLTFLIGYSRDDEKEDHADDKPAE